MRDLSFIGSIFRFNFKGSKFSGAKITRVQPYKFARPPQKSHKGRYIKSLWHNYSMWIYPISAEFDFGLITETKIIKFYVQNAAKSGVKFKGYNFGEAGVDLKGIKEGETLNSREWRELSLIANITGAFDFNELGRLNYEKSDQSAIIRGQRASVLTHRPLFGYAETKSFETNIFRAQNGRERRISLRARPARRISFNIQTSKIENLALSLLSYGMNSGVLVPLWFSASVINESSEGRIIRAITKWREFERNNFAIIWKNDYEFKIFLIDGVFDEKIKSDRSLSVARGDLVIPVMFCSLNSGALQSFSASGVESVRLDFTEILK